MAVYKKQKITRIGKGMVKLNLCALLVEIKMVQYEIQLFLKNSDKM